MSDTSEPDTAFAQAPLNRTGRTLGWMLCALGGVWLVAGLWAAAFVFGVDRGGTEAVTSLLNQSIPLIFTLPALGVLRAGLRRVGPLHWDDAWRRLRTRTWGSPSQLN